MLLGIRLLALNVVIRRLRFQHAMSRHSAPGLQVQRGTRGPRNDLEDSANNTGPQLEGAEARVEQGLALGDPGTDQDQDRLQESRPVFEGPLDDSGMLESPAAPGAVHMRVARTPSQFSSFG